MRSLILASALASGAPLPAMAQTAEETVAYLLFGLEDHAPISGPGGMKSEFRLEGTSPATYTASATRPSGPATFKAVISREGSCLFQAALDGTEGGTTDRTVYRADFSKITGLTIKDGTVTVTGGGLCAAENGKDCRDTRTTDLLTEVPPQRHAGAFAHLRKEFCQGRAF